METSAPNSLAITDKPLASFKRLLMQGNKYRRKTDQEKLPGHTGIGFLESIRMGNICAVLMERLIVPLNNIVEYYLIETPQRRAAADDWDTIEAPGSYPGYKAGLEGFYKQVMLASRTFVLRRIFY